MRSLLRFTRLAWLALGSGSKPSHQQPSLDPGFFYCLKESHLPLVLPTPLPSPLPPPLLPLVPLPPAALSPSHSLHLAHPGSSCSTEGLATCCVSSWGGGWLHPMPPHRPKAMPPHCHQEHQVSWQRPEHRAPLLLLPASPLGSLQLGGCFAGSPLPPPAGP